ncbi:MAG: formyltransferase family protein [Dehalococcoidia bacterium]
MLKLGWFSTGRGEGSRNLLTTIHDAIHRGEIDAEIQFVFTNREPGEAEGSDRFQRLVGELSLELVCYSSRRFKKEWRGEAGQWRLAYDREVMRRLEGFSPDLGVLAGYMLIVGEEMCHQYTMINLHPAALGGPAGTWQEVIWKLIRDRATYSGVKIHLVTEELDRGPALTFCTYAITGGGFDPHWDAVRNRSVEELIAEEGEELPLFKLVREQGVRRELPLIVETLKALAEEGVGIDRTGPIEARDLTDKIEEVIAPSS